jgi:hypothetical protein
MHTSILQVVTPELAEVVTDLEPDEVSRLTAAAERLTLLGRRARGPRTELRYHPLVREFLEARLARDFGAEAVRNLHRTVAAHAEGRDWRIAAHHHWAAGDRLQAYAIIDASAQSIIGRGENRWPRRSWPMSQTTRSVPASWSSRRAAISQRDVRRCTRAKRRRDDPESDVAGNLASLKSDLGDARSD